MYLRGEGVQQNTKVAKIWFERGAEFNEKECLNGLGIIWRDGLVNGKKDVKASHGYFTAAAGQDLAEAQVNLGKYHFGTSSSPLMEVRVPGIQCVTFVHLYNRSRRVWPCLQFLRNRYPPWFAV